MKTRIISIAAATAIAVAATGTAASAEDRWSWGDFWKSVGIDVEGGTVKSDDYETVCDDSSSECGGDASLPDRNGDPKTPPSPESSDKRQEQ